MPGGQGLGSVSAGRKKERRPTEVSAWERVGNEVRLPAAGFVNRSEVIPAHAKVEREGRGDLPVVLEVGCKIDSLVVSGVDIGREYAVGPAIVELAVRPGRLQGVELHVLVFDTHLEAVLAVNPGEVVGHLERLADFVRGQEGVAAELQQVADAECRQTAILFARGRLRDTRDAILVRNS